MFVAMIENNTLRFVNISDYTAWATSRGIETYDCIYRYIGRKVYCLVVDDNGLFDFHKDIEGVCLNDCEEIHGPFLIANMPFSSTDCDLHSLESDDVSIIKSAFMDGYDPFLGKKSGPFLAYGTKPFDPSKSRLLFPADD